MGHGISHFVRTFVADYGYWAVALALLLENTGLPVPGETALLVASFLAYSEHKLHLGWIILIATCAATLGDNIGFAIGHFGGRPLLDRYRDSFHVSESTVDRGEKLFEHYGAAAVFLARFIFGMRILAGPLAGVLRMHWRTFTLFNFLGAATWVTVIAGSGYLFGRHWRSLVRGVERFNIVVLVAAAAVALYIWWRERRKAL